MSKKATVPFRLFKVNTEEFATFPDVEQIDGKIDLQTGLSYGLDEEEHAVKCMVRFQFESKGKVFVLLQTSCEFEIEPKAWGDLLRKKDSKLIIPKGFAHHLAVITIGTARGIFHAKTENTALNKYLIPTVNVEKFVSEDIVIEIG